MLPDAGPRASGAVPPLASGRSRLGIGGTGTKAIAIAALSTIVLFGANTIPDTWLRYLERGIRKRFGFDGTPIRFVTKGRQQRRSKAG